jgi:hypothetical protein
MFHATAFAVMRERVHHPAKLCASCRALSAEGRPTSFGRHVKSLVSSGDLISIAATGSACRR